MIDEYHTEWTGLRPETTWCSENIQVLMTGHGHTHYILQHADWSIGCSFRLYWTNHFKFNISPALGIPSSLQLTFIRRHYFQSNHLHCPIYSHWKTFTLQFTTLLLLSKAGENVKDTHLEFNHFAVVTKATKYLISYLPLIIAFWISLGSWLRRMSRVIDS